MSKNLLKNKKNLRSEYPEKNLIHFVGIGGIGMSGIAEILHNLGYKIQGSDKKNNKNCLRLVKKGIKVFVGHDKQNIKNATLLVVSSAVKMKNIEIRTALKNKVPVIKRSEMLSELIGLKNSIVVSGSHGKTTTTSLISALMDAAKLDPTVINGGVINSYGTTAKLGDGKWIVVEGDESDGSFKDLPVTIAVVTNIDKEHLDHYGSPKLLRESFISFIEETPFYGLATVCIDHPETRKVLKKITDKKILTYGLRKDANFYPENIKMDKGKSTFDVIINNKDRKEEKRKFLKKVVLNMPGTHNIVNSLAAIVVGYFLKIPKKIIHGSFKEFSGIERRLTLINIVKNNIKIFDDYAHHPTEIKCALTTLKKIYSKSSIISVFQPHRYSRTKSLFDEFCKSLSLADKVIISDIYGAGEKKISGINKEKLKHGIEKIGHKNVLTLNKFQNLSTIIKREARADDIIVFLGAGSISTWANDLAKQLK